MHHVAIVDRQQHLPISQRGDQSGQRIIGEELERNSERRWHKTRIDERRKIDEPDAVLVTAD